MPICRKCRHRGEDHNWAVPECSLCGRRDPDCRNCARNRELRRLRGICLARSPKHRCICSRYEPLSDRRVPVNLYAGRLLSRRRR